MKENLKDEKLNFFFSLPINAGGRLLAQNWEITGLMQLCIQSHLVLTKSKNMYFGGLCLSKWFLKAFISVNRKFKPWIELILNLHSCNQSAIEIIQAVAALLGNDQRTITQKNCTTLNEVIYILAVVQLAILIPPLAGWTGEGSSHYGGITARQPWCERHTHLLRLLSSFASFGNKIFDRSLSFEASGNPHTRDGSHIFFRLKGF